MHDSVMAFVQGHIEQLEPDDRTVLEVGSYDVNGAVRGLFAAWPNYLGVDVAEGPGVDVVVYAGQPYPVSDCSVVVSTEMLEHDRRPWITMQHMMDALAGDGTLLLTCRGFNEAGSFPFHNSPDLWRFGPGALEVLAVDIGLKQIRVTPDPQTHGWFLSGKKPL